MFIFVYQTQQMQVFEVSHSHNPIPDKHNDQTASRKHVNENHLELKAPHIFVLVLVSNRYTYIIIRQYHHHGLFDCFSLPWLHVFIISRFFDFISLRKCSETNDFWWNNFLTNIQEPLHKPCVIAENET